MPQNPVEQFRVAQREGMALSRDPRVITDPAQLFSPTSEFAALRDLPLYIQRLSSGAAGEQMGAGIAVDPLNAMGRLLAEHYYPQSYPSRPDTELKDPNYGLGEALPHEVGHKLWRAIGNMSPEERIASIKKTGQWIDTPAQEEWTQLHNLHFSKLRNYQYYNDPGHSFADVFSALFVNPGAVQQHYPEIYDYFTKLLKPAAGAPKPPLPKGLK